MMNFREKVLSGKPLDGIKLHDCHNHMGRWKAFYVPGDGTPDQMIANMDRAGIDTVFVTAHGSIGPDFIYGNDMVRDACEQYPDRIWGYVTVNPNYEDGLMPEVLRCLEHPGFCGIKVHADCHGCAIENPAYDSVYEYADEHKMIVLSHVWGAGQVAQIDRLATRFPNIRWIMGHSGADVPGISLAIDLMNKHPNVYGDTALSTALEGNIEWLVREADPKKILFGTDMPFYSPMFTVGRIAMADISDEIKTDIFGRNLIRLMENR